jgi:hypothetical protein
MIVCLEEERREPWAAQTCMYNRKKQCKKTGDIAASRPHICAFDRHAIFFVVVYPLTFLPYLHFILTHAWPPLTFIFLTLWVDMMSWLFILASRAHVIHWTVVYRGREERRRQGSSGPPG